MNPLKAIPTEYGTVQNICCYLCKESEKTCICLYMDKSLWEDMQETYNIGYLLEEKYKVALRSSYLLRTSFFSLLSIEIE